jgi:hypothetical protein
LADYINDKFMGALEQGALKAALMDWLKLLMFIDHIRNFASERTPAILMFIDHIRNFASVKGLLNISSLRLEAAHPQHPEMIYTAP